MNVEPVTTNYGQTVITVAGEILVACISSYCLVKVAQLKAHINSRMDELLDLTRKASHAEGVMEGVQKEKLEAAIKTAGTSGTTKEKK